MLTLNKNQLKEYNTNGWIQLKNLFNKKETKLIKRNIELFIKNDSKKYKDRHINYVLDKNNKEKINSFHKLADNSWIKKIAKKNKLKKTADFFLNEKSKFIQSELFAKPAKVGLPSPYHQDNFYWCVKDAKALTIWVALEKVDKFNGGICYFNKSHKSGIFRHVASYAKGSSQKIANNKVLKKYREIIPKLQPGDCLIHNCLTIHGSKRNLSSRNRTGITFQYKSKKSKYNLKAKKNYQLSLKKQMKK